MLLIQAPVEEKEAIHQELEAIKSCQARCAEDEVQYTKGLPEHSKTLARLSALVAKHASVGLLAQCERCQIPITASQLESCQPVSGMSTLIHCPTCSAEARHQKEATPTRA